MENPNNSSWMYHDIKGSIESKKWYKVTGRENDSRSTEAIAKDWQYLYGLPLKEFKCRCMWPSEYAWLDTISLSPSHAFLNVCSMHVNFFPLFFSWVMLNGTREIDTKVILRNNYYDLPQLVFPPKLSI